MGIEQLDEVDEPNYAINEGPNASSEASLNEDEMAMLAEMEKNDKELEEIAGQICGALD